MIKKIIKFLLFLTIILIIVITYLSFFGITTKKLNNKIKNEILNINKNINLELKSVKLLLNPFDLSINIKTLGTNILFDNNQIKLENIITNISLKSLLNNQFSIDDLKISTKAIKLKDLISLVRSFKNSTELFILDRIIEDGFLVGDIYLNFDNKGKIKDDYVVKGFIKKGKLSFFKKHNIENLNLLFKIKKDEYFLEEINTKINQIKLSSPSIKIIEKKNLFLVSGKVVNSEKSINFKLLNNFLGNRLRNLDIKNINFSSDNDFTFSVDKKFKISDLYLKSKINLNNLDYKNELLNLKKYFPNFKELIRLQNHEILINYKKNKLSINGKGELIFEDKKDEVNYKVTKINDEYIFNTNISIIKNSLLVNFLDYKKKENLKSLLKLNGIYKNNNGIKFKSILFYEKNNSFIIKNLKLIKKLKILNIDMLKLDYINNNKIQNQINLKKNKKNYKITGKSFDATKLIDMLLSDENNDENFSIFYDLTSSIDIKITKTYLDSLTFVNNLLGNIKFINNKISKANLNSTFPNNKKFSFSINTNDNNEKITTIFSGHPKTLLDKYNFIKGFEEGALDFYSIKKNNVSNSLLTIYNFKVQEVPVLAKLLTLASLQGIADLLTGEGIRFTELEMKFSNKEGLMNIEEMYAIGPAISILLDGYIQHKKLISLRGTLVPATTINKSIASIPLIGNILIGKKTGEGIFGVSFKIKGAPGDLKTTVNPIKTLTPRFITRTLEKIKKN
jgi:hypothetical protein